MTPSLSSGLNWIGLASSFLLVLGLLALLLFALKRMQGMSLATGGQRQIQQLESLSAGTRQKIVLLRVKDREILVGVSATQITALAEWTDPVTGATAVLPKASPYGLAPRASTPPSAASSQTGGSAPAGALSFAAVLEHARTPNGLVRFFKRRA